MTDGGVLDRLLGAQPVFYSVISSAAEYQRQIFGVQAQQHNFVKNNGATDLFDKVICSRRISRWDLYTGSFCICYSVHRLLPIIFCWSDV